MTTRRLHPDCRTLLAGVATLALVLCCAFPMKAQKAKSTAPAEPTPAAPAPPPAEGQEFDRIVAVVNGDVILDSDVDEERRFNDLQPYRDGTAYTRDKAIERLINRDLILQQAKLQPEDDVSDAEVAKELDALRKTIPECKQYACETEAGWQRFLASKGFTEETLAARWKVRMESLRFIEERFRAGIRITPAEIKAYYDNTMLPEYAKQHAAPPRLDTISDRIQEVLLQQQVSNLLGDWLKSLRAQGSVVLLKQGEVAP